MNNFSTTFSFGFFDPFGFHLVFSTIQTLKFSKSNPFTMPPQAPIVLQIQILLFQKERCYCGWASCHTCLQYNFMISSFYIFPSLFSPCNSNSSNSILGHENCMSDNAPTPEVVPPND